MLKSTLGHVKRHLYQTPLRNRLVTFTGDDLWYSVRGGALNSSQGGFGGDSILRERIDFWENTSYGHGGAAKIWAGLNHDHGKFEEGKSSELGPVDRDRPVFKKKEDRQLEAAEKEQKFLEWTREYYLNKQNMGWSNNQICGRYIPNMFPADAIKEFGRTFDDFRCCILDMGRVSDMVPKLGRIYKQRITVMVGNGKGVYGIATVQTDDVVEGIVLARSSGRFSNSRNYFQRVRKKNLFENLLKRLEIFNTFTWMKIEQFHLMAFTLITSKYCDSNKKLGCILLYF